MIKIVTDSTAYLSQKTIEEFAITVVPLSVHFGNDSFWEGQKYTNEQFYKMLRENRTVFPTTSQPSAGMFLETYQKIATQNDEIISIHLSGNLSGTVKSAETAAYLLADYKITVIDSYTTIAGLAFMVKEAARLAKEGKSQADIVKAVEYIRENLQTLFMVDTFEYLKRGGRIGGAQALLGTILQIKPVLYVHGSINVFAKIRTKHKALQRIIAELKKYLAERPGQEIKISILNVDAWPEAMGFEKMLREAIPELRVEHNDVGPVIGAHVGPGTLGIAFTAILKDN